MKRKIHENALFSLLSSRAFCPEGENDLSETTGRGGAFRSGFVTSFWLECLKDSRNGRPVALHATTCPSAEFRRNLSASGSKQPLACGGGGGPRAKSWNSPGFIRLQAVAF